MYMFISVLISVILIVFVVIYIGTFIGGMCVYNIRRNVWTMTNEKHNVLVVLFVYIHRVFCDRLHFNSSQIDGNRTYDPILNMHLKRALRLHEKYPHKEIISFNDGGITIKLESTTEYRFYSMEFERVDCYIGSSLHKKFKSMNLRGMREFEREKNCKKIRTVIMDRIG